MTLDDLLRTGDVEGFPSAAPVRIHGGPASLGNPRHGRAPETHNLRLVSFVLEGFEAFFQRPDLRKWPCGGLSGAASRAEPPPCPPRMTSAWDVTGVAGCHRPLLGQRYRCHPQFACPYETASPLGDLFWGRLVFWPGADKREASLCPQSPPSAPANPVRFAILCDKTPLCLRRRPWDPRPPRPGGPLRGPRCHHRARKDCERRRVEAGSISFSGVANGLPEIAGPSAVFPSSNVPDAHARPVLQASLGSRVLQNPDPPHRRPSPVRAGRLRAVGPRDLHSVHGFGKPRCRRACCSTRMYGLSARRRRAWAPTRRRCRSISLLRSSPTYAPSLQFAPRSHIRRCTLAALPVLPLSRNAPLTSALRAGPGSARSSAPRCAGIHAAS